MATIIDDAKRYQNENQIQDDAAAKALREQNYKGYFQQQLQLAAAKQLGNRYYQESLERQGLGSSGEGATGNAIMNNAFMNQQQTNLGNYLTEENKITSDNATRWQNEQASKDANLISQIDSIGQSSLTTEEKRGLIEKLTKNYGYGEGGNASSAVQSALDYANAQISSGLPSGADSTWYNDQSALTDIKAIQDASSNQPRNAERMYNYVKENGDDANNSVFELVNSSGHAVHFYYNNGKYYKVTAEQAEKLGKGGSHRLRITWRNDGTQTIQ